MAYGYGSGTGEQGWYDNVIAVDPGDPNHLIAGGIAMAETKDGGTTWLPKSSGSFGPGNIVTHPDFHALAFRGDGKVLVGNDGGPYLYSPATTTIVNLSGNLNITQFYPGFNVVGSQLLAGSQDNGTALHTDTGAMKWARVLGGDGGYSSITSNQPATMFAEAGQGLYRTTDSFVSTLTTITPPSAPANFTPPMLVVPNIAVPADPTVYYGGVGLWRTSNPSNVSPTWTNPTGPTDGAVSAVAVAPSNPYFVYVGYDDGALMASTDGGMTFGYLTPGPFTAWVVTGLSVNPSNPNEITASFSQAAATRHQSANPHVAQWNGASWTNITGNLPSPGAVNRVVYDSGNLVAATEFGVFGSGDGGATWSPLATGLPNVQVEDLWVDAGGLYAVTHGRGAWKLSTGSDFSVGVSPSTVSVGQGKSVPVAVSTTVISGTPETVALSASGLPAGVTAVFTPASVVAGGSSTLTLSATAGATLGTVSATVTGAAPSATHSGPLTVVTVVSSVPSAPQVVAAAAKDGAALVSWQPPGSTGGSPITSYTVTVTGPAAPAPLTVPASPTTVTFSGLTDRQGYSFAVTATNSTGTGPSAGSTTVFPQITTGEFVALTPARILDTRFALGHAGAVGPGQTITVAVAGAGGVPASGVSAVVINMTVTNPTQSSWLTVFPSDAALPLASNLNFSAGQTIPNLVTVKLGADGTAKVYNAQGSVDVIGDVVGWYSTAGSLTGSRFTALAPTRLLDTRNGRGHSGAVGQGQTIDVAVAGTGGVPTTAVTGVVMNVTVTNPTQFSWLTVFPSGATRPVASNLDFPAGQTIPNLVAARISAGNGALGIYNAQGSVDVIADVTGWFNDGTT